MPFFIAKTFMTKKKETTATVSANDCLNYSHMDPFGFTLTTRKSVSLPGLLADKDFILKLPVDKLSMLLRHVEILREVEQKNSATELSNLKYQRLIQQDKERRFKEGVCIILVTFIAVSLIGAYFVNA